MQLGEPPSWWQQKHSSRFWTAANINTEFENLCKFRKKSKASHLLMTRILNEALEKHVEEGPKPNLTGLRLGVASPSTQTDLPLSFCWHAHILYRIDRLLTQMSPTRPQGACLGFAEKSYAESRAQRFRDGLHSASAGKVQTGMGAEDMTRLHDALTKPGLLGYPEL